jgi:hypothetical protein
MPGDGGKKERNKFVRFRFRSDKKEPAIRKMDFLEIVPAVC